MRPRPIEDHGVIGDLQTIALVGRDGAIDFMCFPSFDSPTIFCALLDAERGGSFQIAPSLAESTARQIYLPDTNVLLTRFLSRDGVAEISDFMVVGDEEGGTHTIVRRVKTVRGEVRFRMTLDPRFDYGRAGRTVTVREGEVLFVSTGPDGTALRLRTPVPVKIVGDGTAVAEFTLPAGTSAPFVLEPAGAEGARSPSEAPDFVSRTFKETVNFWRRWAARSTYGGRWREAVTRSALTLKLLVSRPHGSIVAAPTFGLPEEIGGVRNWDYRYTWIRDASFTLYALNRLGYHDEASAFMRWFEERCADPNPDGSLQIMYRIDGRRVPPEETLPHLRGYGGSVPVRIGNGAEDQLQLDIYGELMDTVYLYDQRGEPIHHELWLDLVRLIDWVCASWRLPDEGIWEVRGGRRELLFSRFMCWVAVDRGVRLAIKRSFPAPLGRWRRVRDEIYRDIHERFWSPERRCFVQYRGGTAVDASALLMPLVKFTAPRDPRWLSTLAAIEKDLVDDSLVYRYRTASKERFDGIAGGEGTFSMCSFWYIECLSRAGDLEQARFLFEKMLGYANHLGLYGEELGPHAEHLGNFPQAFTHIALISAAFNLDRQLSSRGRV